MPMQGNTCVRLSPSPGGEGGWSAYMILFVALRAVRLLALFSKSVTLAVFAALARGLCLGPPLGEVGFVVLFYASFEARVSTSTYRGHYPRTPSVIQSEKRYTRVSQILCVLVFVPGGRVSFLSPLGLPRPNPRGALCAACSQARQRPCCAVARCDAGWKAPQRRAVRCGLFSVSFFAKSRCVFCVRLPAVAPTVGPGRSGRARKDVLPRQFSPFGQNGTRPSGCIGAARARAGFSNRGALEGITAARVLHFVSSLDFVDFPRNWSTQ
jgi:hypothetical protein